MLINEEYQDPDMVLGCIAGFVEYGMEVPLHDWQRNVHMAIDEGIERPGIENIAVRVPNEGGKTAHVCAPAALAWMALNPHGLVVYTSAVGRQVESQFMPSIMRYQGHPLFKGFEFKNRKVEGPNGSTLIAFTTNDAGKFEGYHNRPMVEIDGEAFLPPLLIIVDEAKTVPDAIYEAIDRCRADVLLLTSSPAHATLQGEFYRAFTKNRRLYLCFEVGLEDCPHLSKEKIQQVIDKYGIDHPFVRSSVFGEFPQNLDEKLILKNAVVDGCRWEKPDEKPIGATGSEVVAWLDFAAGGDENVIAVRRGNVVTVEKAWREKDTMIAAGDFIRCLRAMGIPAHAVWGDNSGLGKPIIDRMAEIGYMINRFNSNCAAEDSEVFFNAQAEMWDAAQQKMRKKEVILIIDDTTYAQLTTRRWNNKSDGKFRLESKETMREMGEDSPDRAEGVVGVIVKHPVISRNLDAEMESYDEWLKQDSGDDSVMEGMETTL